MNTSIDMHQEDGRVSRKELLILAGLLVAIFFLRLVFLHLPLDCDEGAYGYIGQEILRGAVPYRDVIDHKPPGIHYIYAAMVLLAGNSPEGIRIVTTVVVIVTVVVVWWFTRAMYGARAGILAGGFYGVFASGPISRGISSNCETFMVLPLVLSFVMLVRWMEGGKRRFLLYGGLFAGFSMLIKPTAVPFIALALVFVALSRKGPWTRLQGRVVDVALYLAPVGIMELAVLAYYYSIGAIGDFIYWNFTFNRLYGKTTFPEFIEMFVNGGLPVAAEFLPLLVLAVAGAVFLSARMRTASDVLTLLLLPVSFIAVSLPGKFAPYYFILMVFPLAVAAGIGTNRLWSAKGWRLYLFIPVVLAATFYTGRLVYPYFFRYTPDEVSIRSYSRDYFITAAKIARYIESRTAPTDTIFVWGGEPEIYFLSGRRAANRFISVPFIASVAYPEKAVAEMLESIRVGRPKYIVLQQTWEMIPGFNEFTGILLKNYSVEVEEKSFLVFRLNSARAEAPERERVWNR